MSTAILIHCQRCAKEFDMPDLSEAQKTDLALLARSGTIIEVVRRLCREAGMDRRGAKFLALHITRARGVCHRCYYPLLSEPDCPHCGAVNFDW